MEESNGNSSFALSFFEMELNKNVDATMTLYRRINIFSFAVIKTITTEKSTREGFFLLEKRFFP